MEKSSTKTKKTSPEVLKITQSHHGRIETKKSDRKGQTNSLAIQTLYSPKKRPSRGKTNSRPIKTKQVYKLPSFKMPTIQESKYSLLHGYWTISLDLLSGYWHIPVAPSKRTFLGFRYRNQNWLFRALPFGLCVGPRAFTKVISHIVKLLAKAGIWCLPYLDDLLLVAREVRNAFGFPKRLC